MKEEDYLQKSVKNYEKISKKVILSKKSKNYEINTRKMRKIRKNSSL